MSYGMTFLGYAPGAIKDRAHLLDHIIEARKRRKAVKLYAVEQGGHFSEVYLTSKSNLSKSPSGIESFNFMARSSYGIGPSRYYRTTRCLDDLNIGGGGHNRHQLFANRRLAQEYSDKLKADKAYQSSIVDFHRQCDRLFGRLGWQ